VYALVVLVYGDVVVSVVVDDVVDAVVDAVVEDVVEEPTRISSLSHTRSALLHSALQAPLALFRFLHLSHLFLSCRHL